MNLILSTLGGTEWQETVQLDTLLWDHVCSIGDHVLVPSCTACLQLEGNLYISVPKSTDGVLWCSRVVLSLYCDTLKGALNKEIQKVLPESLQQHLAPGHLPSQKENSLPSIHLSRANRDTSGVSRCKDVLLPCSPTKLSNFNKKPPWKHQTPTIRRWTFLMQLGKLEKRWSCCKVYLRTRI